jgi:hypothetical protein
MRRLEEVPDELAHQAHMTAIRKRTGNVGSSSKLVSFLYELMRDHVAAGVVEKIMFNLSMEKTKHLKFCNGHLAKYAKDVARRLGDTKT